MSKNKPRPDQPTNTAEAAQHGGSGDLIGKYVRRAVGGGASSAELRPLAAEDGESTRPVSEPSGAAHRGPVRRHEGGLLTIDGTLASMLDCRFRNGRRLALPYSYLAEARFDPAGAIRCVYPSQTIAIHGRSLAPVYAAILSHTAIAIIEAPTRFDEGDDGPFIERIEVEVDGEPGEGEGAPHNA